MGKMLAIAKQEFRSNAKRKGYLLFAIILPALFLLGVLGQAFFGADVPKELIMSRSLSTPIPLPILFPSIFGAIFAVAIFNSSGFLLYGMVEEKENRLIEILLTSVSTRQLLLGKILGLGALGIVQMLVWLLTILLSIAIYPEILWMAHLESISLATIALTIIFFILGYFLFAVILAGIGSMLSDTRQAHQISGIVTIVSLIPSWATLFFFSNPNSGIAVALSYFPITGSITMAIRMLMATVPTQEILASAAIAIITIIALIIFVEKKLKGQLLVYEKKLGIIE